MIDQRTRGWRLATAAMATGLAVVVLPVAAGDADTETNASIAQVLAGMPEDVRIYNDHLVTLASPFMEGRLPGSHGMAIATEYMEFYFREAGLEPPFPITEMTGEGAEVITERASFRQGFPMGESLKVVTATLAVEGDAARAFVHEIDFSVTAMGGSGTVTAPVTLVGYSIEEGPDGYASFAAGDDLAGRVAMMFRFEPMDETGSSQWGEGRWSRRAGFAGKLQAAASRNPEAIIVVNTPGADDPRVETLMSPASGGRGGGGLDVPVLMMTPDAAERLLGAGEDGRPSLLQLRRLADMGRTIVEFDTTITIDAGLERESIAAENVGGLLPGRGALAEELIVVGAHLDHLGMGYFGSRSGPGALHPGADDNASGSAGILIFADKLARSYEELPDDAEARSVLFIGFTGEESGLNGSRHYVENPIVPLEQHDLMVNFDMIGRIENERLTVTGTNTAEGMAEWIGPYFEASPLEVTDPGRSPGGSDHLAFIQRSVPTLFGIITDFHGDYHTPADTSEKINRVGAVKTIRMFHDIVLASAQRPEGWTFDETSRRRGRGRRGGGEGEARGGGGAGGFAMGDIKVRFGIRPGQSEEETPGILIDEVTPGGSAEEAGVLAGDRLIRWDGVKLTDTMSWFEKLAAHEPGDTIMIGVLRDGAEVTLEVTLQSR